MNRNATTAVMEAFEGRCLFAATAVDVSTFSEFLAEADANGDDNGAVSVSELKAEVTAMKVQIAELKSDYNSNLTDLKAQLKEDLADAEDAEDKKFIKSDYNESVKSLKEDLKEQLAEVEPSLSLIQTLSKTLSKKKNVIDLDADGEMSIGDADSETDSEFTTLAARDGNGDLLSSKDFTIKKK